VSAAEKKHKWQYLSQAVIYQVTLLFQGRRRKLTPLSPPELHLAQSYPTGGMWGRASGPLLLVACSQRFPPTLLSRCSRIPRTPMTLSLCWALGCPEQVPGGTGAAVRQPCPMPVSPGLLSLCRDTLERTGSLPLTSQCAENSGVRG